MAGPAPLFREIHRLRKYAHDLQEKIDRIPRDLKRRQDKLAEHQNKLRDTQEAIRKHKLAASDKEKTLKAKNDQIIRWQQQREQVSTRRESDALDLQIAAAKTACSQIEDEALQELASSDEKTAWIPEMEQALAKLKDDYTAFETELKTRQADLQAQLAQAQQQLQTVEADVPDDLRPQYKRTITSMQHDGFASVVDRTCTACYTEIIRSDLHDLENDKFIICKSCGRILYLPGTDRAGGE